MTTVDDRERRRREVNLLELQEIISRGMASDGAIEALPGLYFLRSSLAVDRAYGVTRPSFCVTAQGAKNLYLGHQTYRYDADNYLVATVELPFTGKILQASRAKPYLGLLLELDPASVSAVMIESGLPAPASATRAKAVFVSTLTPPLLDATLRLARLVESQEDARVLAPALKREVIYRLLQTEQGERVRHLPMLGSQSTRIAKAIHRLRTEFDNPISMESLAKELGMSTSGFHQHFKAVTDMSPLQYQKQIRLQEARQLMLAESLDASSAAYRVGYDDPSHFSRDYKKHFGEAPLRDVQKLRATAHMD